MGHFIKKEIGSGIEMLSVPVKRFKTNEIAVSLAVPITEETASANALVSGLLCRSSRAYPDLTAISQRLAGLYGAMLLPSVSKVGELQVIKIGLTCIDDRFSLDATRISIQCLELLFSLLLDPNLNSSGLFSEKAVEVEKRILIEKIESEENEKRTYVLRQTEKVMFSGEPYGISCFGEIEQVRAMTAAAATNAWKNLLSRGKILISVVGSTDIEKAEAFIRSEFLQVKRNYTAPAPAVFVGRANKINTVEERIRVKQGKLVLGFRADMLPSDELTPAMRCCADIFGGGPYSLLFAHVREKMSLCYYCSARYIRQKSIIMVQCGCEEENMDRAVREILRQLEEMKKGNFMQVLESSKMAITDAVMSVNDEPDSIENWYVTQISDDRMITPEESAEQNNQVTAKDVEKCASLISLDTVYKLVSVKEGEG